LTFSIILLWVPPVVKVTQQKLSWYQSLCHTERILLLLMMLISIFTVPWNVFLPCRTSNQALFCSCPRAHGCSQPTCPAHFQDVEAGQSGSKDNTNNKKIQM